jgi:hypothetical protein
MPAEPAGGEKHVVAGENLAGGAVHDHRSVLAVSFQALGDRVDVSAPRVAGIGPKLTQRDGRVLDNGHSSGFSPTLGIVLHASRIGDEGGV